jgi:hypothetical protein
VTEFELERALSQLRDDLESDLRRVEDDLRGELTSTRHAVDSYAAEATDGYEGLDQRCRSAETTAQDALDQVRHTAAWLARYTRAGGPRTVVDPTDRPDPSLAVLAAKANEAAAMSWRLLSQRRRAELSADITALRDWQQAYEAAEAAAIAASATLANADRAAPAHDQAAVEFGKARAELTRLDGTRERTATRAEAAGSKLEADNAERAEHNAVLAAGDRAGIELHRELRDQIVEALDADALFALWFTSSFGFAPTGPDWLDLAVDVCAYRITFNIHDETPLGGAPNGTTAGHRRDWHDRLLSAMAEQRQH